MGRRVVDRHPEGDSVIGLFADVASEAPDREEWDGEDPDNYRFLTEAVADLGIDLTTVRDGRGVWGLNWDQGMLANNRVPFCSRILKHEPCARWLRENCDPENTVLHVGIDWTEAQRCKGIQRRWGEDGWKVEFPLVDPKWGPLTDKTEAFEYLKEKGIKPPRMYTEGFPHANCSGACSRMGNDQAVHLLFTRPHVFHSWEEREQAFRQETGKDVAILVDRRGGGPRRPYTLKELRVEVETSMKGVQSMESLLSMFGDGFNCGCHPTD